MNIAMKTIFSLLILFLIFSCNKTVTGNTDDNIRIIEPQDRLIPYAVNNYWVYDYSLTSSDTSYSYEYKEEITGYDTIGNIIWYRQTYFQDTLEYYYRNYIISSDSVFDLQYNWTYPLKIIEYIVPSYEGQILHTMIGGDVTSHKTMGFVDSVVSTSLSDFSDCYYYKSFYRTSNNIEFIKYGVGIVKRIVTFWSYDHSDTTVIVTLLKDLDISNEPGPDTQ